MVHITCGIGITLLRNTPRSYLRLSLNPFHYLLRNDKKRLLKASRNSRWVEFDSSLQASTYTFCLLLVITKMGSIRKQPELNWKNRLWAWVSICLNERLSVYAKQGAGLNLQSWAFSVLSNILFVEKQPYQCFLNFTGGKGSDKVEMRSFSGELG